MRYSSDRHIYRFLAPEDGYPTWEENFIKNIKMQGHTSKLNLQKQWGVVSKSAAIIYPSKNIIVFPYVYYWPITEYFTFKYCAKLLFTF